VYVIQNVGSGLYLDVKDHARQRGASVIVWKGDDSRDPLAAARRWRVIPTRARDLYVIQDVNSGLYLDVKGSSRERGAPVVVWKNLKIPDPFSDTGRWRLVRVD
jgi:hypothetical protein